MRSFFAGLIGLVGIVLLLVGTAWLLGALAGIAVMGFQYVSQ